MGVRTKPDPTARGFRISSMLFPHRPHPEMIRIARLMDIWT